MFGRQITVMKQNIRSEYPLRDLFFTRRRSVRRLVKQEVKVIGQKAPHGGPILRLVVTPGGRKLYTIEFLG